VTNDRYDLRFLRDAKVDRFGSIVLIGAYLALLLLTLLSVLGKIQPPITLAMRGADVSDEALLAWVVLGVSAAVGGAWVRLKRSSKSKDVL
jgi:hypothetical protein